jgi:hypothetical protein
MVSVLITRKECATILFYENLIKKNTGKFVKVRKEKSFISTCKYTETLEQSEANSIKFTDSFF